MIIEGQAGISLGYRFWSRLAEEMANLVGIEIASFNRYYTIEVARTIIDSGRANEIALYTGNDDNIINDLLTTYKSENKMDKYIEANIVGGLLSHWAAWTRRSVEIYRPIKKIKEEKKEILRELLMLNLHVTTEQALTFGFFTGFSTCYLVGVGSRWAEVLIGCSAGESRGVSARDPGPLEAFKNR